MKIDFKLIGAVEIPHSTWDFWWQHRQRENANETGGVIAGFRENGVWILSSPMPPNSKNKAGRTWLKRDRESAQEFVNEAFKRNDGRINYLGEWHTHPEPHPNPSCDDFKMLKDLLRTSKLEIDFLMGVIVGDTGELCIWIQTAQGQSEIIKGLRYTKNEESKPSRRSIWKKLFD
jgi:integrative and conjugative element protein (TIGR02256 family)